MLETSLSGIFVAGDAVKRVVGAVGGCCTIINLGVKAPINFWKSFYPPA
jgi:hypothetical protein